MKNYSKMIFVFVIGTLLMTSNATYAMKKKESGEMSLSTNVRAICGGIENTLSDPSTLISSAFLVGWHSITHNNKYGFFDANTLRDRQIVYSLAGGIAGKVIKRSITDGSYKRLPSPLQVMLSNSFLTSYIISKVVINYDEIKNNPLPFAAELGLLGLHWIDKQWNG